MKRQSLSDKPLTPLPGFLPVRGSFFASKVNRTILLAHPDGSVPISSCFRKIPYGCGVPAVKVAAVFTGGTIGSSSVGGVKSLDGSKDDIVMGFFDDSDTVVRSSPYSILSENLDGDRISSLIAHVASILDDDYDGIIITHGTDTIQYATAALGYAFGSDTVPITVVSGNAPLGEEGSNAEDNIRAAVDFIRNRRGRGVFVPYLNSDGAVYVHRGARLLPHPEYEDSLASVCGTYYGRYVGGRYEPNPHYHETADAAEPIGPVALGTLSLGIMVVNPYPGMGIPEPAPGVTDVLLDTYHSGTFPESAIHGGFLDGCSKRGIRVWIAGRDPDIVYESMSGISGVRILPRMSLIAAYMKIWMSVAAGRDPDTISEPLGSDIALRRYLSSEAQSFKNQPGDVQAWNHSQSQPYSS